MGLNTYCTLIADSALKLLFYIDNHVIPILFSFFQEKQKWSCTLFVVGKKCRVWTNQTRTNYSYSLCLLNIKVYETPYLLCQSGVLLQSTLRLIRDFYDLIGM